VLIWAILGDVGEKRRFIAVFAAGLALASCAAHHDAAPRPPAAAPVDSPIVQGRAVSPHSSKERRIAIRRRRIAAVALGKKLGLRRRPVLKARVHSSRARNPLGQQLAFLVLDESFRARLHWLKVLLPERPNGSSGWVRAGSVRQIGLQDRIEIDLSSHQLRHYRGSKLRDDFRVGIGAPGTPTPTGLFFVWAKVVEPDPDGAYGPFALGLSGFSPTLSDWPGGGRVAIHGTADPGDRGQDVSHGCIRVYNPEVNRLRSVPMGTPVVIRT
jgi:lipoprotein-anchoring transpeptidase ErfK/SrfK